MAKTVRSVITSGFDKMNLVYHVLNTVIHINRNRVIIFLHKNVNKILLITITNPNFDTPLKVPHLVVLGTMY